MKLNLMNPLKMAKFFFWGTTEFHLSRTFDLSQQKEYFDFTLIFPILSLSHIRLQFNFLNAQIILTDKKKSKTFLLLLIHSFQANSLTRFNESLIIYCVYSFHYLNQYNFGTRCLFYFLL